MEHREWLPQQLEDMNKVAILIQNKFPQHCTRTAERVDRLRGDIHQQRHESKRPDAVRGFRSRSHARATRGHPLSKARAAANRVKSRIRARIEHVFGAQEMAPGGRLVRTIGIVRARAKIGLQNFVYNVRRLATLEQMAAA